MTSKSMSWFSTGTIYDVVKLVNGSSPTAMHIYITNKETAEIHFHSKKTTYFTNINNVLVCSSFTVLFADCRTWQINCCNDSSENNNN
jgi:hypothetical protein